MKKVVKLWSKRVVDDGLSANADNSEASIKLKGHEGTCNTIKCGIHVWYGMTEHTVLGEKRR